MSWRQNFSAIRGRITENAPLAQMTWFRVGGPADLLFKPADLDDLANFLKQCPADVKITPIGVASNLLIRDGGIEGVALRLGREFTEIKILFSTDVKNSLTNLTTCHPGEGRDPSSQCNMDPGLRRDDKSISHIKETNFENFIQITCGAAALDLNVAMVARDVGIGGLEFLSGIPGTIGGALRMNAGAYGREIKDVLVSATAIDRRGTTHKLSPEEMQFSYRHCGVPEDWIFIGAVLQGTPDDPVAIQSRMDDIKSAREASQPTRARTGGSTFANPPDHLSAQKAWQLIDQVGCRGLHHGGAQMSELHCNFMINTGDATAADLENLGEKVRQAVLKKTGITLEWEIRRIGRPAPIPGNHAQPVRQK